MPSLAEADEAVESVANQLRGLPGADPLFYAASEWGDWSKIWHVLGLLQTAAQRDPEIAVRLSIALGLESAFVNGFLKSLFKRERPTFDGERPLHLRQPKTSSFPSGHASSAFMAAAVLSESQPAARPLYYAAAAIVAYSRIHVKIHHATDVAGGVVVGIALGRLVPKLWPLGKPPFFS